MKCCVCKKEIDTSKSEVPPTYFRKRVGDEYTKAICAECNKKPENQDWWKE